MGIGQQQPIRDTVDEVCTDVSRIIYAIFSENQNDNTLELLRLKLDVQKTVGNLNKFVKVLRRYATGKLIDMFIEQLIEKYTTEEQRKAFIKEVCETVLDSLPTFNIEERLYRILSKKYDTEEYRNIFLRLAAEQGNLNAVKYFVEKGADISAQDEMGYTPLHLAAKRDNLDIVKYLIEKGADISAQDEMGYTPLHLAAKQGNLDIVKYLIEKGANVDVYFYQGGYSTPLHLAAANGHLDTVKYLMAKGANPNAIDGDGKTPLQRANEKGISDIVEYLAERVPQVTEVSQVTEEQQTTERQQVTTKISQTTNKDGDTALHLAAVRDDLNAVRHFVEKGKDEKSDIPLDEGSGYVYIAGYFTEKGQQVTEMPQVTEGRQVTERSRVTEVPQVTRRQQATTNGRNVTEQQQVTTER